MLYEKYMKNIRGSKINFIPFHKMYSVLINYMFPNSFQLKFFNKYKNKFNINVHNLLFMFILNFFHP